MVLRVKPVFNFGQPSLWFKPPGIIYSNLHMYVLGCGLRSGCLVRLFCFSWINCCLSLNPEGMWFGAGCFRGGLEAGEIRRCAAGRCWWPPPPPRAVAPARRGGRAPWPRAKAATKNMHMQIGVNYTWRLKSKTRLLKIKNRLYS